GSARVPRRCAAAAGADGTSAALPARLARLTVRAVATPQPPTGCGAALAAEPVAIRTVEASAATAAAAMVRWIALTRASLTLTEPALAVAANDGAAPDTVSERVRTHARSGVA